MNHLRIICVLLPFLLSAVTVCGQTNRYKGTMTVGNYVRENTVVEVRENGNRAEGTIFQAKFSRLMPVTVDVNVGPVQRRSANGVVTLTGKRIIPTVKGEPYEKYLMKSFDGVIENGQFEFSTFFGDKPMHFKGKVVR